MHTSALDLFLKNRKFLPLLDFCAINLLGGGLMSFFTEEDKENIRRAMSERPDFKTKSGFTGNKRKNVNKTVGKNKRRTAHLTNKQRKKLTSLHKQVDNIFISISHISSKDQEDKLTKKDMYKGKNRNEGAYGVHSIKTFNKYKSMSKTFVKWCYQNYENIEHVSDIKPGMYIQFIEDMVAGKKINGKEGETMEYSPKTVGAYISAVEKMCEASNQQEFERLGRLEADNIREKIDEFRSNYQKKEYKRGKNVDGRLGYTLREAQTVTKKAYELSPYYGAMFEVLTYSGPRIDELRDIKWRQLDLENNRIYLDDPGQTKGGRPRFVPIPEKTSQKLKELVDTAQPSNLDTRIWGSNLTEASIRKLAQHCCKEGKIGYSGIHDFRRSAVEYHMRQLKKDYEKGKLTREQIVQRILDHVGADERLNPIVPKKKRDGYRTVTLKDGTTKRISNWVDVPGEFERKYTFEKLNSRRIDFLMNTLIAETLGHNRSDSTSPYKNG